MEVTVGLLFLPPSTLLLNLTSKSASECNENRESVSEKRKFKTQRRWKRESETDGKRFGGTVQLQGIWDPWQRFVIGAGSARVLTAVNAQAARMGNTHRLCCSDLLQWRSAPGYTHMQSALGVWVCVCAFVCVKHAHHRQSTGPSLYGHVLKTIKRIKIRLWGENPQSPLWPVPGC